MQAGEDISVKKKIRQDKGGCWLTRKQLDLSEEGTSQLSPQCTQESRVVIKKVTVGIIKGPEARVCCAPPPINPAGGNR